ncbi:MAG: HAD-IIB family hydrolase [Desulfoarculaceae bacterium]|nr:HAD-IIB family hydrolase [Desulfoarculaceae bacterium]
MTRSRLLLCTDLDRTLIPNGMQPESPGARALFARLSKRPEVTLVYVTGRHRQLVAEAVSRYRLPQPDLVISDVGTRIYTIQARDWQVWTAWEEEVHASWNDKDPAAIHALFGDLVALRLQEGAKQSCHKLSYYVELHHDHDAIIIEMKRRLSEHGIKSSLVWSIDETSATGLLDVLPENATKLHAIRFIKDRLGFSLAETVFAGDSGNDLSVLASEIQAVLVANADDSVRRQALIQAQENGHSKALYLARGGALGLNGNYGSGILEGVLHYLPAVASWLQPPTQKGVMAANHPSTTGDIS